MTDQLARDTQIFLDTVRLVRCSFKMNETYVPAESPREVRFDFNVQRQFPAATELSVIASISLFKNDANAPYSLEVAFEAICHVDDMVNSERLKQFALYNAPGILIPYLREAISNITSRSGYAALVMPPVDIKSLVEDVENPAEAKTHP